MQWLDWARRIQVIAFVQCTLTGGSRKPSHETLDVQFFGPEELPELSVNRVTRAQVLRMFEHCRDASLPSDFD